MAEPASGADDPVRTGPRPPRCHLAAGVAAYNDEETIRPFLGEVAASLARINPDYRLVVINDGSRDGTEEQLRLAAGDNPRVSLHPHRVNRGFGPTIREAYLIPDAEWVVYLPGDAQIPPDQVAILYQFTGEFDAILGRRSQRQDSFRRKLHSWCYNIIISLLARRRIRDVNSTLLVRRDLLDPERIVGASAFIHAELLLEALRRGARLKEVEITHRPRVAGVASGAKWNVMVAAFRDTFDYAFRRRR